VRVEGDAASGRPLITLTSRSESRNDGCGVRNFASFGAGTGVDGLDLISASLTCLPEVALLLLLGDSSGVTTADALEDCRRGAGGLKSGIGSFPRESERLRTATVGATDVVFAFPSDPDDVDAVSGLLEDRERRGDRRFCLRATIGLMIK
jgi:hypothetical protein